ncbi:MAG: hypothetical protein ABI333_27710 [bacterium]
MAEKKKEMPNFLTKSACKEAIKAADCNMSGDALDGLNELVAWYLQQATKRAVANGRKTVRAHDFAIM